MHKQPNLKKPVIAVIGLKGLPAFGGSARAGENMMAYLKNDFRFVVFNTETHTERSSGDYDGIRQIVFRKFFIGSLNTIYYYLCSAFYCLFRGTFDVVHVFHVDAAFIVPLLRFRYLVISGHRARPQFADKWGLVTRNYFRIMEWLFFKMPADVVTSVNREVVEIFRQKTSREILYVPNGINLKSIGDLPEVDEKDYVLFASGRIIAAKGAHLMIDALERIGYTGRVLVIGSLEHSPEYGLQLQQRAQNLDIRFVDIIKDKILLMAFLKHARAFVFPSYHEGMSNMLLEAVSVKVPVVCSDISGNRQAFSEDEVFFFRSGDVSSLASRLEYVLDHADEASRVAEKGYQKVYSEYNWDSLSRRYAEIYNWLLVNKRPLKRGEII